MGEPTFKGNFAWRFQPRVVLRLAVDRPGFELPVVHLQRRVCSMKREMVFGALVLSVALCSQGFAETLLGGCGCAHVPRLPHVHRAQKPAPPCAPACGECGTCCPRCDLFRGLKDLFACHRCGRVNCCCEKTCGVCAAPKPCAPACCACPKPCAPVCCPARSPAPGLLRLPEALRPGLRRVRSGL